MARKTIAAPPPTESVALADWAVRHRSRDALPEAERATYDAVVSALAHYEVGEDADALEVANRIGLQSPFREWKLLVRGLVAYSANDDARAVENWQRLGEANLPAKMIAPLRAKIDAAFRDKHPPGKFDAANASFTADRLLTKLQELRGFLGRGRSMDRVWKAAEAIVPLLAKHPPEYATRLARILYLAIPQFGSQQDIPKHRKLFGAPADDPDYARLDARACELSSMFAEANRKWGIYAAWLAKNPPGWPAEVARRARATVLQTMGENAVELHDQTPGGENLREAVYSLFKQQKSPREPGPTPETFFRDAMDLAPGWPKPALALIAILDESSRFAEAEKVAEVALARNATDPHLLDALAALLGKQRRSAELLQVRQRALAANPLDQRLRSLCAHAFHETARRCLAGGQAQAALALLDEGRELCPSVLPGAYWPLRSVTLRKLGQDASADAAQEAASAVPYWRLSSALLMSADAALAKLKPAQKKPLDAHLKSVLASEVFPREVSILYATHDSLDGAGFEYRGQKTQEKTIQALHENCVTADAPEADFEILSRGLTIRHLWKLAEKVAGKLLARFPTNPAFMVDLAEAMHGKGVRGYAADRVGRLLAAAKSHLHARPREGAEALLRRIAELQTQYSDMGDLMELFLETRRIPR